MKGVSMKGVRSFVDEFYSNATRQCLIGANYYAVGNLNMQRHCAYSMRFFKHIGLRAAWNVRVGCMLFLVCCGLVVLVFLSLLGDCWPVVDRQLHTFFASPKKVCQKRRRKVN
jgi:hypothetical protein